MKFDIEFKSTTYRTYSVEAPSPDRASKKAQEELDYDETVSNVWKENAEITGVRHG